MTPQPLRIAGMVLAVGVAIGLVAVVAGLPLDGVGSADRTIWVADRLALWTGLVLVLLASPALYVRQYREVGVIGMVGFALIFMARSAVSCSPPRRSRCWCPGCTTRHLHRGLQSAQHHGRPPLLGIVIPGTDLLTGAGFIAFGFATARAAVLPRAAGYVMAGAGTLLIIGAVAPSDALFLVGRLATLPGFVAAAWMGLAVATAGAAVEAMSPRRGRARSRGTRHPARGRENHRAALRGG
ncbi:MAG: hypothetical protein M3P16_00560 [Chloroflexota bacterium]|nr:hypothetical protein [Chloroflexota bacterium]